jgi:hypothetical protein
MTQLTLFSSHLIIHRSQADNVFESAPETEKITASEK